MQPSTQTQAAALLGSRQLVFTLSYGQSAREDWDAFSRMVDLAVGAGATHIEVGQLPFRHGSWVLPDNDDPYAAWSATSPALLRVFTPEPLHEWVSPDHANWCQDYIDRQMQIIRAHNLRAILSTVEPHWLPEAVYRAHPHWRGAQCELGRLAMRPYFAPSIDEPEVLDLCRQAITTMIARFPEIELVEFLTNDSGGGIAWTPCIYPGMNGPTAHRTRNGGERIATWLNTLREAADKAGGDLRVNISSSGFQEDLRFSVRAKLNPGVYISDIGADQSSLSGPSAALGGALWHPTYPVVGLSDPGRFLKGISSIYHNPDDDALLCRVRLHDSQFELASQMLTGVINQPGTGTQHHATQMVEAATWFAGNGDDADAIIHAWEQIRSAVHALAQIRQKGFGQATNFCSVTMRWLLRPLVPEPNSLTADETAHYRPFVFAAGDAKGDPRFTMVLGKSVFNGESVMWMSRWCLQEAIDTLRCVSTQLEKLDPAPRVTLLAARAKALACVVANLKHCIMYQYALDISGREQFAPNPMDYDDNIIYDHRALNMRKVAREDLDTTAELIGLIDAFGPDVMDYAPNDDEQSVFRFGPDLAGSLRKKMTVMLDHWQDYERLFPSTKVYDFEPSDDNDLRSNP